MRTKSTDIEQSDSAAPLSQEKWATQGGRHSALKWFIVLLPFAYLWFRLIDNLRLEWSTDPQYGYGWVVPLLCIGLLVRRWHAARSAEFGDQKSEIAGEKQKVEIGNQKSISAFQHSLARDVFGLLPHRAAFQLFVFALAFLYLPTRLIEAAVPEWRPIQWSLGIIAIGLTLCAIYAGKGAGWLRQTAFPICFLLVAVPWPTLIEGPIIQGLTRLNTGIVVEVLGVLGVPALQHGNIIEVSTGMVGIDDACSGIRSFQSSLMISLFFGEFYRFGLLKRLLLVPVGFMLAIAFNVLRTSILTLVAAKKGIAAISEYHDSTGITILLTCTAVMWGVALWLRKTKTTDHGLRTPDSELPTPNSQLSTLNSQLSTKALPRLALVLIAWLFLVESGVQIWYRSREAHLIPGPAWTLTFPRDNPTLKDIPMDATTRKLLRFDEFKQAAWTEPDGTRWEAFYFSWLPGRVAGYLAKRHTPEICLAASGITLISGPKLTMMNIHGVELPIRCYEFQTGEGVIQVFHCRWEAGVGSEAYVTHESARYNLIRAIWAGRGNKGQKVLEIIVSGMDDPAQAKQALERELNKLIVQKH